MTWQAKTITGGGGSGVSSWRVVGLWAVVLVCCVAGCGEVPPDPGVLTLQWAAGPALTCQEAGLETVEVALMRKGKAVFSRMYPCQEGAAYLDGLEAGRYELRLTGRDAQGTETFGGVAQDVRVGAGGETWLGEVAMSALPGVVTLRWFFDDGRMCAHNQVEWVWVQVYNEAYYDVGRHRFVCDWGEAELGELQSGHYIVEIRGEDGQGQRSMASVVGLEVTRGGRAEVEVALAGVKGVQR